MKRKVSILLGTALQIIIVIGFIFYSLPNKKNEKNVIAKTENIAITRQTDVNSARYIDTIDELAKALNYNSIETYYGTLTAYGPDCFGCSGITSTGFNAWESTTYYDEEFGEINIVAADPSIPFYSIIKINVPNDEPIYAIVLDRGSNVGFDRFSQFDLLMTSEYAHDLMSTKFNIQFDLIRYGK